METLSTLLQQARSQGIVFIDPRIDYAFKLIFGTPGNEDLLLHLVQAILPDKGIVSVSLEPQEPDRSQRHPRLDSLHYKEHGIDEGDAFGIPGQLFGKDVSIV